MVVIVVGAVRCLPQDGRLLMSSSLLFTFVLWCCSRGDGAGVRWHEEAATAAATPFNIFYKKSVSVLDRGKNLVRTEKFEKQEMRQTKVRSCLTVTRISSTLFFFAFYSAVWDFFSHSFYTSFGTFPVFPAPVSVRESHTPVSSSLAWSSPFAFASCLHTVWGSGSSLSWCLDAAEGD